MRTSAVRGATTLAAGLLACFMALGVHGGAAATSGSYPNVVFSDGFESGTLAAWNGQPGNGSISVVGAAAHAGSFGTRMTNTSGQFSVLAKGLSSPLADSSVSFWVRVNTAAGLETIAQARDGTSSAHMWDLMYDAANQRLVFFPYSSTGSTEIDTAPNTAPLGTWFQVEMQYTATATGGAQLYINGQTQPSWGVSGDYTRGSNLQIVQLWNDAVNTTDFDDVVVAAPAGAATLPGAPTNVSGSSGNGQVALSWTAPTNNGGGITGYRITPYVGPNAQTPILTGSSAASYTVTGLTNGTAYTFTVAALTGAGTGPDSAASGPVTPSAGATVPGAPSGVGGLAGSGSVTLSWTAPSSDGGSAISGYVVTPYVGGIAQTPQFTGSNATTYTATALTNATTYTFTVAAVNSLGTGGASPRSAPITPPGYSNVLFADGFESGSTSAWDNFPGNGSISVVAGAAHSGNYGARMTNTSGQFSVAVKALASPVVDSAVSFWVRVGAAAGLESIAQARDGTSSAHMWDLYYDGSRQGLVFLPYSGSGSAEIFTGVNSVPVGTWTKVELHYTATTTGGAQIYVNNQTQASWAVTGNYTRTANLQRVQLWNDAVNTTDFDDVKVATPPPTGATAPGAPSNVTGVSRDRGVALSWTAPSSDGGSPISGYRITPYVNGAAQAPVTSDGSATSYAVNGLTNGTSYTFRVAALNGVGYGLDSASSAPVTPNAATAPSPPSGVNGIPHDSSVALSWTAPSSDGGSSITGYTVTPYIGGVAQLPVPTGSNTTSTTITGLTNGTTYTFTVAATNAIGTGAASAQSAPVTPVPALSQYTNVVFADGFETGSVSKWDVSQGTGAASVLAVAAHAGGYGLRLQNLESQYRYLVKALSSPIADSDVTFWVRLPATAGVTTIAQSRDGTSSAHMWDLSYDGTRHGFIFYPYTNTGSRELFTGPNTAPSGTWIKVSVQYTATATGGAQLYVNGQTQPGWGVSGNYTRTANLQRIQLWNDAEGTIDFDDMEVQALPPTGAVPPDAPSGVVGAPLDSAVQLNWMAPTSDGGSPITGYQITPYVNGVAQAAVLTGSAVPSFVIAGLTNNTTYTFTVAALNAAGTGANSAASGAVTPIPAPPPGPPTALTAKPSNASANLTWTAPASDGGSPITNYRITPYIGGVPQTPVLTGSTNTSYTVTGLTNNTTYTFTVAASNTSGFGAESSASGAVTPTPNSPPGAPTSVTGSPRNGGVALTWVAPDSDGGTPITGYRITPYVGSAAQTPINTNSTATGYTVSGLINGTAYTFTVAALNAVGVGPASAASAQVTPAIPPANPIVLENRNAGTTSWQFDDNDKATNHEIEGYASLASVNKGSSINFMVNLSSNANYTMDVYRMGWYPTGTNPDGTSCAPSCGGRLMMHIGPLQGHAQPACSQDTIQNDVNFGLTECSWTPSYTLSVPASWTTGNYIVKLIRSDNHLENYMTFVVRDDASTAPVIYSMDVTTWQAYNFYGGAANNSVGYDLYGRFNDVSGDPTGGRAYTVSFDRPYDGEAGSDGAGSFFDWDFPMIRWMESKGYDISYVTDVDVESNPSLFNGHRLFVNTGHDEYYSDNMRNNLLNAVNSGVNMAFFSANDWYYRSTWSADAAGSAYRRIHSDKNALPGSTTYEFRLLSPAQPENQIGGVMLEGVANDRPFLVSDASSWIYSGTGLTNYSGNGTTGVVLTGSGQNAIKGIIGYEFDARASTTPNLAQWAGFEPSGVRTVGHSFVPAADGNGVNAYADTTLYTAPSGATVFSAGTIQWSWGVDNGYNDGYCGCPAGYANSTSQKITENVLDRLGGP